MIRGRTCCLAIFLTVWIALSPGVMRAQSEGDPRVPEIVLRALGAYETNVRGVIGMQRHFSTLIDAGIVRHSEQSDSGLLLKDGMFVRVHYYRIVEDGRDFSAKQLADRDKQANDGWSSGKIFFKEPYDRRFVADYEFKLVSVCRDCPAGTAEIRFSSATHDEQHGAGTMWIDVSSARVVKLSYVPYVFPPHATSGIVSETTLDVLPNLWYVARIEETYTGRALLLRGTGTFTASIDHFQRFATLAEGENAVRDGTIGTVVSR